MKLVLKNPLMSLSVVLSSYLMSSSAFAQVANGGTIGSGEMFSNVAGTASANIYGATSLISTGAYTCGAGFGMAGLLSLKKHAENATQEPINKGLGRLAVGAGLCTLPFVMSTAMNSMGADDNTIGINGSINRL